MGIAKSTAYEAIQVYEKATKLWGPNAETELANKTITEAKIELGVTKPTSQKSKHKRRKKRGENPKPDGSPQFTRAAAAKKKSNVAEKQLHDVSS